MSSIGKEKRKEHEREEQLNTIEGRSIDICRYQITPPPWGDGGAPGDKKAVGAKEKRSNAGIVGVREKGRLPGS